MDKDFTYDEIKDLQVHLYDSTKHSWVISEIATLDKLLDLIMPVIREN
jgi:hypothetical protein